MDVRHDLCALKITISYRSAVNIVFDIIHTCNGRSMFAMSKYKKGFLEQTTTMEANVTKHRLRWLDHVSAHRCITDPKVSDIARS